MYLQVSQFCEIWEPLWHCWSIKLVIAQVSAGIQTKINEVDLQKDNLQLCNEGRAEDSQALCMHTTHYHMQYSIACAILWTLDLQVLETFVVNSLLQHVYRKNKKTNKNIEMWLKPHPNVEIFNVVWTEDFNESHSCCSVLLSSVRFGIGPVKALEERSKFRSGFCAEILKCESRSTGPESWLWLKFLQTEIPHAKKWD